MADDAREDRGRNTYGVVFLFAVLFGPFVILAMAPVYHGAFVVGDVGIGFPESLLYGVCVGLIPGFVLGVIYALLPRRWWRPIAIALVPAAPLLVLAAVSKAWVGLAIAIFVFVGALGCALAARLLD